MFQLPKEPWLRLLVLALVAAAIGYLVWRLKFPLGTVLLAAIFTYVLRPPVNWLSRFGMPRWVATLLVYVLLGLLVWGAVALASPSISHDVDRLQVSWHQAVERLPVLLSQGQQLYQRAVPAQWRQSIDAEAASMRQALLDRAKGTLTAALRSIPLALELMLVPVLAFYFLSDPRSVRESCLFFVPPQYRERVEVVLKEADQVMDRYIQGQLILCSVAFVVVGLGLWALHLEFALTLGLVAGVTRAIPIVGPIFGGIPVVAVGIARSGAVGAWLLVAFALMHFFESKYLMPKVLGFKLGVHPVLIIISLLIGGEFFGLVGMFLAAPALAIAQRLISRSRSEPTPDTGS